MQLFFGTCLFFVAVVLLAYMPGKLLLMALKRTLTPLEDVTLACVLGLVRERPCLLVNDVCHQGRFYFVWPLTAAGSFCLALSSKTEIALKQFFKHRAAFPRKRDAVARQVQTCFSRSPGAWNRRIGIFPPLLHQFYMAAGWHDARLSGF